MSLYTEGTIEIWHLVCDHRNCRRVIAIKLEEREGLGYDAARRESDSLAEAEGWFLPEQGTGDFCPDHRPNGGA